MIGIIVAVVVVFIIFVTCFIFTLRRRRKQGGEGNFAFLDHPLFMAQGALIIMMVGHLELQTEFEGVIP